MYLQYGDVAFVFKDIVMKCLKSNCTIFSCLFQKQLKSVIPENMSPLTQFFRKVFHLNSGMFLISSIHKYRTSTDAFLFVVIVFRRAISRNIFEGTPFFLKV